MNKSIRKPLTLVIILFVLVITACIEQAQREVSSSCPNEKYYSNDLLKSQFYQGWQLLQNGNLRQQCKKANKYFSAGLDNNELTELTSLYHQYCSFPQILTKIEKSSIYQEKHLANGISEDEFKWLINLALCGSVVEQYAVGKMLYSGFIIDKNIEDGLNLLALAAKQDHILAQQALADALDEQGEHELATKWRKVTQETLAKFIQF